MGMSKRHSPDEIRRALELHEQGLGARRIARLTANLLGIHYGRITHGVSIAQREDVLFLDTFVGAKG